MIDNNDILKKRVYAFTTDCLIIVITNYFFIASFIDFIKLVFFHFTMKTQLFFIQKLEIMTSATLATLFFSYFTIFYFVTNGQTMGKNLFGLRVVSSEGEIGIKQAIQRSSSYLFCALFGSFLFALSFIRKDGKSLADVMSKTSVIYDDKTKCKTSEVQTEFQLELMDAIHNQEVEKIVPVQKNKAA